MSKQKRAVKILTIEEKIHKALCALFVLQAVQLKISNAEMRKLLGVATSDINPIAKAVNKALRKLSKEQK